MKHTLQLTAVVLLLALLLTACGVDPSGTTGGPASTPIIGGTESPSVPIDPSDDEYFQTVPAEVDNPDGLPVLSWVCHAQCYWSDEAARQVNEALAQREMPFRLQFTAIDAGLSDGGYIDLLCSDPDVSQELLDAVENADILYSYFTDDALQDFLMPITQYAQSTLENIVPHELYWDGASVGDEIYGVTTRTMTPLAAGWVMLKDAPTKLDFEAEDFDRPFWELDDILAQIYKSNKNEPFISQITLGLGISNTSKSYYPLELMYEIECYYELIGSCFAIDHRNGTPQVINYLETDYTRNCQAAVQRYFNAGYFRNDGTLRYYIERWSVYADEIYQAQYDSRTEVKETVIPNFTPCIKPLKASYGITKNSQHKAEALMLLELLANDREFLDLVLYGDKKIDEKYDNKSFLSAYHDLFVSENQEESHPAWPAKDGRTVLETHRQLLDNAIVYTAATFDFSSVQKETDAVNEVLKRYLTKFTALTEAEYTQMLAEIKEAGSDKILRELQSQLDTWLAENRQG